MQKELPFTILDVAEILGLEIKRSHQDSVDVNCPFCRGRENLPDKHGHMNLNIAKGVFRCNRCGRGGLMLDLYVNCVSEIKGCAMNRKQAFHEIVDALHLGYQPLDTGRIISKHQIKQTDLVERASDETIDKTYHTLIAHLPLFEMHRQNLLKRGLDNIHIRKNMYVSMPVAGGRHIAEQLLEKGCTLKGVPGFFETEEGNWTLDIRAPGFLVPIHDVQGHITGFQIRKDYGKHKYNSLTSIGKKSGLANTPHIHFSGFECLDATNDAFFYSEGPLKGDVSSYFSHMPFVTTTGCGCYKTFLQAVPILKSMGFKRAFSCYDMDRFTNRAVYDAANNADRLFADNGFSVCKLKWNPDLVN